MSVERPSGPLEPTLDSQGQVRLRVAPWFLRYIQELLVERDVDMAVRARPDGTAEILLRRLPLAT